MVNQNYRLTLKIRKDDLPSMTEWALIMFFSGIPFRFLITRVIGMIGLSSFSGLAMHAVHLLAALLLCFGFYNAGKKKRIDTLILYLIIGCLFLFSYLFNPSISSWFADDEYGILNNVIGLEGGVFAGGIIGYVAIRIQKDANGIFKSLKYCNVLWIIYLVYVTLNRIRLGYFEITYVNGKIIQLSYHMSFGYYCTFISILNFALWKKERKIFNIILGSIFALLSVAFGARGVILVYALYLISIIWISLRDVSVAKKVALILIIGVVTFLFINYFTEITIGIQQILNMVGMKNSRTLTSMLSGELSEANGRDQIWAIASDMIKQKFPFGYGVYGERPIVGQRFGWGYCHDIFLELIVAFGAIGLIISIYLVIKSALIINNTIDKDWNLLFIMFFSNCGMLLISNSFWYHSYFWATIAVGVTYMKELRNQKKLMVVN